MSGWRAGVAALLFGVCSCDAPVPAAGEHDASADAAGMGADAALPVHDAATDSGVASLDGGHGDLDAATGAADASRPHDASEAPADAAQGDDAEVACGACVATSPCERVACVENSCQRSHAPAGTLCGERDLHLCVRGACVMRGCGDGFREPGPMPTRESCDDGRADANDGCNEHCAPEPVLVDGDDVDALALYPTAQGAAVVLDGLGNVLWVYTRETADGMAVRARLPHEVERPSLELAPPSSVNPEPSAIGLASGGFLVAWTGRMSAGRDVFVRFVGADGTLSEAMQVVAPDGAERREARLVAYGPGGLVVFIDSAQGVAGRVVDERGAGVGERLIIDGSSAARTQSLRVARRESDDAWLVAWLDRGVRPLEPWRVWIRRYSGLTALDARALPIASEAVSVALAGLASDFVLVYGTSHAVGLGDVMAQRLPAAGPPESEAQPIAVDPLLAETNPAVAALDQERFVVGYWAGRPATLRLTASAGELAPEVESLRLRAARGAESDLSLTSAPEGVWFAWSGTDSGSTRPTMSLFFLPES